MESQQDSVWDNFITDIYASSAKLRGKYNTVEITNLPKKIDAKTLTSLIISNSRITPKTTNICLKKVQDSLSDSVALVEFKSESDAHNAVAKLKEAPFGRRWRMTILKDPKINSEGDVSEGWIPESWLR